MLEFYFTAQLSAQWMDLPWDPVVTVSSSSCSEATQGNVRNAAGRAAQHVFLEAPWRQLSARSHKKCVPGLKMGRIHIKCIWQEVRHGNEPVSSSKSVQNHNHVPHYSCAWTESVSPGQKITSLKIFTMDGKICIHQGQKCRIILDHRSFL